MIRILSSLLLCMLFAFQSFAATGTTGSIRGVVNDKEKGEPQAGILVVATSPNLQGEQSALTDEKGFYVITDLTPGTYTVRAEFGGAKTVRDNIAIQVDKTVNVNLAIALKAAAGEVYTITEAAPNIDVASSTVGVTLTQEVLNNVPIGRTRDISSALNQAPTAGADQYGVSIGGATSPENAYVIDGINITGPSTGLLDTRLVLDFIDEFQIKEGGYGPEFGRATGGYVNVVTKGGSNNFHGSAWAYFRPGFLQAAPRQVSNPGNSLLLSTKLDYYLSAGFEIGGPIVKDVLWFHTGYSPELTSNIRQRKLQWIQAQTDANGAIVQPFAPVFGVDGQPVFEQSGLLADGTPYAGYSDRFFGFTQTHEYTAKITHLINNNNRHSLSARGSPSLSSGANPNYTVNGDPSSFTANQGLYGNLWGAVYDYAGKFFSDKLKIDAVIGVHHQEDKYRAPTAAGDLPRINYTGTEVLNQLAPNLLTGPNPCTENFAAPIPGVGVPLNPISSRCLAQNYNRGGLGFHADENLSRFVEKIAITNLFEFAGLHQLKWGIDFEQIFSDLSRWYSGGGRYGDTQTGNGGSGSFSRADFALGGVALTGDQRLKAKTSTYNWGAFIGDSWNPIPSLILNYGLRWEWQNIAGIKDAGVNSRATTVSKFSIADNFAPRAGIIWDFTGKGKGAVRFNFGRFYESIPLDLNERGFGGETFLFARYHRGKVGNGANKPSCLQFGYDANGVPNATGPNGEPNPPILYTQVTDPAAQCKIRAGYPINLAGGADDIIEPGLKGQFSDELVLSADWEPFPSWIFGVTGIYRYLGSVIEDMSTDGGNTYLIANPGHFDLSQLDGLRQQLNQTTDPVKAAELQRIIAIAPAINSFPTPKRDTWQVQFKVDKKLSNNFQLTGTYVLSWSKGNYPGLFSANNGQLDPNITSQFDLPQLILNRDGYLPQDTRHRIKLAGFYKARLKDWGICAPFFLTLGVASYVQSGQPYEYLGADDLYGTDEVFMLPRGSGGRTPWIWNVDMNLSAGYEISDDITFEFFGQVYNLFNTLGVTTVDNRYTASTVRPLTGGTVAQLPYAQDVFGAPVLVNPNFGNATQYQAPLSAQFGARLKF
jgi:hypothetical protein